MLRSRIWRQSTRITNLVVGNGPNGPKYFVKYCVQTTQIVLAIYVQRTHNPPYLNLRLTFVSATGLAVGTRGENGAL